MLVLALLIFIGSAHSQLLCHPETLTYRYVSEIRLWGVVEQRLRVTCQVELDCHGVSDLSKSSHVAFDYIVHINNMTVSEGGVESSKVLKLCLNETGGDSGDCAVEDGPEPTVPEGVTVSNVPRYDLPVRFTQTGTGTVIRVQFMEKDIENREVLHMKKGIISALQTKISKAGETSVKETDSMGTHTAHYRSHQKGGGLVIDKDYTAGDNTKPGQMFKTVDIRGSSRAHVDHGEVAQSQGEVTTKVTDDTVSVDDRDLDLGQGVNIEELLHSYATFDLKLVTKTERSVSRRKRMAVYGRLAFLDTSLEMEDLNDNTEFKFTQLSGLYDQLHSLTVLDIVEDFLTTTNDQKLTTLGNAIFLEASIGFERVRQRLDRQEPLVDQLVQATYGVVNECGNQWDTCREILELYIMGGGRRVEEVFEFLLSTETTLDTEHQLDIINLLSAIQRPSDLLVRSLIRLVTSVPEESDTFSALLLSLGSLAGQSSVSEQTKSIVRAIILKELETIAVGNCTENVRHADALEAIGNMGDVSVLGRLLDINSACGNSKVMRVALIHATRGFQEDERVQALMVDTLSSFECDVSEDMLNLLLENLQDQELNEALLKKWPLSGFTQFDEALSESLMSNPKKLKCLRSDAIQYFRRKLSPAAMEISKRLDSSMDHHRTTRGLKKHSSCSSWSDHKGRYKSIQSAKAFSAQSKKFNKRKSCLAHFGIGPKQANVNVYAAYFAGYKTPAESGQRRLFTKVVANGKILKKGFTIGTVYLYLEQQNKNLKSMKGRVYAKVGNKVLLNKPLKSPSYKSTKKLFSPPTISILIARIPVYITTINVHLKLSARVELTTHLRLCNNNDICLTFTPNAIAKATASATASVEAARVGADLSFNFNYYVKGEGRARLSKAPCVSVSHGHGAATVDLKFFFQVRTKVKVKVRIFPPKFKAELRWGKKEVWKKGTLKWTLKGAKESKIFSNC